MADSVLAKENTETDAEMKKDSGYFVGHPVKAVLKKMENIEVKFKVLIKASNGCSERNSA
tara:strand:+ start:1236 stop:1415 length:180 start_codon:yes stop_codon:yes gene_type:complete